MNYIKKLESENKALKEQISRAVEATGYLQGYLQSDKFHQDPTVQVQDVLNRLSVIRESLLY